jgi:hypothetical protein
MGELRDFVAEVLERRGAAVEAVEPDGLEVLLPQSVRDALGWPELAVVGFSAQRPEQAIPIGLEGDWLDRFGALLREQGRWSERQLTLTGRPPAPGDPERVLEHALDLPNAVWRFHGVTPTFTRCLLLTFRYTALSDEKREGLISIGFNLGTGAVIDEVAARLRRLLAQETEWQAPEQELRAEAGPGWDAAVIRSRVRPLLDHGVRQELEPFLRAMRRRLERDRNRVHGYHDDLRRAALKRLGALGPPGPPSEKAEAERRRETLRVAAIEGEYRAKLDDLRHNYALRVTVDWVQALTLYVPVQRFEVLIRRRKGERLISIDWHPLVRLIEPLPCEAGLGLDRTRFVCDHSLHLIEPPAPCGSCNKGFCRACHPAACPRCGAAVNAGNGGLGA